jgi:hypothetical protein
MAEPKVTIRDLAIDLFRRFTSRKFLAAAAGFTLILLHGYGYVALSDTVLTAASSALVVYIGAEATGDIVTRYKSGTGT